jgi:DNA replication protein DnaC
LNGKTQTDVRKPDTTTSVDIYIGALIEHESERQVLESLNDYFIRSQRSATIFANINVLGRQIDFVVATSQLTLLIEAKGYSRPVRGSENGDWEIKAAAGGWIKTRNPYIQTTEAKHALRDAMRAFVGEEVPYPNAGLIIVPKIPTGSNIWAGDYKVAINGLEGMENCLAGSMKSTWDFETWRAFAKSLNLLRVRSTTAAYSHQFAEAERTVRKYSEAFRSTYGPTVAGMVADSFWLGEHRMQSDEVVTHVVDGNSDILIHGPSGCGKTLLSTHIGLSFLEKKGIPLSVQAKHYEESLKELLDRESALLDVSSTLALLRAAKILDIPLLLIIDGYNECSERRRLALTRSLCAAARRYRVQVVVTSQCALERPDLLNLESISVREPSLEVKVAIAAVEPKDTLDEGFHALLGFVSSGLEARLAGEIGSSGRKGISRHALFDAFSRSRLLEDASEGIRMLMRIGAVLLQRLSFSLSVRDLDRLADANQVSHVVVRRLQETRLLIKRGDRVSFRHELFFCAFAAEAAVREADGDAAKILIILGSPRYHASRTLILGAIDDEDLLIQVLSELSVSDLLIACWRGECGQAARQWVAAKCHQMVNTLKEEASGLQFMVNETGWMNVGVDVESLLPLSRQDSATLDVIAAALRTGEYLDCFLEAIAKMDASLARSHIALLEEAREKKISLRSALFANAYVFNSSQGAGLSRISAMLHSGWMSRRDAEAETARAQIQIAWHRNLTPGQVYFLLMLSRHQENPGSIVAPYLAALFGERWRWHPYHLQLDLMQYVHWCRDIEQPHRSALIESIEALLPTLNPIFSGMAFEALEALGALEDSEREQTEAVRSQMANLLENPADPLSREAASYIYGCQFDHPLSGAYIEVVQELNEDQKKLFLMLACDGETGSGFFVSPLIIDLAAYGDSAAGRYIQKWTRLPARDSFMPQEAITIFVSAHIALGYLGCNLPDNSASVTCSASAALSACGALHYWISRKDISEGENDAACATLWKVLMQHEQGAAAAILECENSLRNGMARILNKPSEQCSLVRRFPLQSVLICREALRRAEQQVGYFPHAFMGDRHGVAKFSISVLGKFGDSTDLTILKAFCDDPDLGTFAIAAIRKLEERGPKF